jgi:hypothetical protein
MTYFAPAVDIQISRVHSVALQTEIAERLRMSLDDGLVPMPPHLRLLMKRLCDKPATVNGS